MMLHDLIAAVLYLTGTIPEQLRDVVVIPGERRARCYVRTTERAEKGYDHWAHVFSIPRVEAGQTTRRSEP